MSHRRRSSERNQLEIFRATFARATRKISWHTDAGLPHRFDALLREADALADARLGELARVQDWERRLAERTRLELLQPNLEGERGAEAGPAPALPASVPSSATGRALVVDDQEQVRMTTSDLLQELGFTTEECESGLLAEQLLARGERFDLVVTDHLMPGLTGADLAARLATTRPEIGVLIVSGYADSASVAPGLHLLRKPFRKDELAAAVDGVLRMTLKPVGVSADRL